MMEWSLDIKGQIPEFSLSPQGYVKLVVEHLIVLRHLLEPYDYNEAMHLERSEKFQTEFITTKSGDDMLWEEDMEPTSDVSEPKDVPSEEDREGFASQWISAVARATMTLYIEKISQIETLTTYGAMQLSVDLNNFCNVVTVLGVKPDQTLAQILTLLNIQTKEEFDELPQNVVTTMIGRKRGWIETNPETTSTKT